MNNLCNKVFCFCELMESLKSWGAVVFSADILRGYDEKATGRNILLVSHELTRTGAPVAIYNFAKALKNSGDNVFVLSPTDGAMREMLDEDGIPVICFHDAFAKPLVKEWIPLLDAVIVNTIAGVGLVSMLGGSSVPVLWWIHEANISYHKGVMDQLPEYLPKNVKVFCVGDRPLAALKLRRPNYTAESLLYTIPDEQQPYQASRYPLNEKLTILCIGVQEYRKGQDILVDAFGLLDDADKEKIRIIFIGKQYYEPIWSKIDHLKREYPDNIAYISELPMKEIRKLEQRADCIVCSSRDDPMPIVLTEMMMMSKTVITSEFAGQASIVKDMNCGYVYENNDPAQLAEKISRFIHHPEEQNAIRRNARVVYENFFSEQVFNINARAALQRVISECKEGRDESVSVVIPGYNGMADLKRLIPALKEQKRANLAEIILIDSGSTDGSDLYAEEEGCTVIRITQQQFSHSYARNLGASKAAGKYILFMTQDALPEDAFFVCRMARPLTEGIAAAVSCRQIPRPDCDLYGKVSGQVHANYMLFPQGDRILRAPAVWDADNVRRNAQLDDVACMVHRDVFRLFQYRGDYAEDLDLGMRLIQSGYFLALLDSARVIHSHRRPAYYHLRRAVVDNAVLNKMLPGTTAVEWPEEAVVNRILSAYLLTQEYIKYMLTCGNETNLEDFRKDICDRYPSFIDEISGLNKRDLTVRMKENVPYFDEGLKQFALGLAERTKDFTFDNAMFGDVLYFMANSVLDYIKEKSQTIDEQLRNDFCDTFVKRLGTMIGISLTYYSEKDSDDGTLRELIRECRKGI